jgi:hypothetical protein
MHKNEIYTNTYLSTKPLATATSISIGGIGGSQAAGVNKRRTHAAHVVSTVTCRR